MPYSVIPSYRIPYDRIASVGFQSAQGVYRQLTATELGNINSERFTAGIEAGVDSYIYTGVVLPEAYDIRGWSVYTTAKYPDPARTWVVQVSTDTTTGTDGTWNNVGSPVQMPSYPHSIPETIWRSNIVSVTQDGIKGVRIYRPDTWGGGTGNAVYYLHLYGYPTAGFDTNRLDVWDATLDQRAAATALDWGDVARNTIEIRQVRIKNLSATQTANTVTVSATGINASGTEATSQHSFSLDNVTFTTTVSLGNLAPGAISPIIYVRRNTLAASPTGLYATRLTAVPASWS
jgi:hypothetical protein